MEEYVWVSRCAHHPVHTSRAHPVLRRAAEAYGVKVTIAGADDLNREATIEAIREATGRGVAGIMILGWRDRVLCEAVDAAVESGVPVVTVDGDIPNSKRLAHVGTDWFRMGSAMAQRLADLIEGRGKVLMTGVTDMANMESGFRGFAHQMLQHGGIEVVGPEDDLDVGSGRAREVVERHLKEGGDLAGVAGFGANSGPGAAEALEGAGLSGKVKVVCVDADEAHLEWIRKGGIQAAFCQKREFFTYSAFQLLYAYNHGSAATGFKGGLINIPGNIDTGHIEVTGENVDTFEMELSLDDAFELRELGQQLAMVSAVLESSAEVAIATDLAGRIAYVNPAGFKECGLSAEEVKARQVGSIFSLGGEQSAEVKRCAVERRACSFETEMKCGEGAAIPVQLGVSPMLREGMVRGLVFVATDITSLKEAEAALAGSEAKYRELAELLPEVVFEMDERGVLTFVNRQAYSIMGYTKEAFADEFPAVRAIVPEDRERAAQNIANLMAGRQALNREYTALRADGSTFPILTRSSQIVRDGRVAGLRGILVDITERKEAEEALRESAANYHAIFDAVNDAIFVHDPETAEILDANEKMTEMFGYGKDEIRHMTVGEISSGEKPFTQEEALRWIRRAAGGGEPTLFEWMMKAKDGTRFWAEVNLKKALIGGKERILAVVRDITARRQLEEQVRQSQKMEAVGRLAGGVAHDFNNLLTAITGYAHMLEAEFPENGNIRSRTGEIREAAEVAARLTRQLLAFGRKQVMEFKATDINRVVRENEGMIRGLLGSGIRLTTQLSDDVQAVWADENQLEQIILNFSFNARDAMGDSGEFVIRTANADGGEEGAPVQAEVAEGPYVELSFTDTGCGMDEETVSHIFEPFYTTKDRGTGLGLSTVYGIVKQHRGQIEVESAPGEGTTFRVLLPSAEGKEDVSTGEDDVGREVTGRETVLVVEDDDLVRGIAVEILTMYGYEVLSANGGEEALAICREHEGRIDLMVTDIVMPEMDGRTLYAKASRLRGEMKGLFMSGHSEMSQARPGSGERMVNFLQKPFSAAVLAAKVREVLEGKTDAVRHE